VALRPLITYSLEWLTDAGATRASICANGSSDALRRVLGDEFHGVPLAYHADPFPRGSGGCVRDAAETLDAELLVVVEGTVVPLLDLHELIDAHERSGATMTVVTDTPADGLHPRAGGIYVLHRRALDHVAPQGFQDLKENVIPRLYRAGELVLPYASSEALKRVATLETYLEINQWLVERLTASAEPNRRGRNACRHVPAEATAGLDSEALCVGPVLLGRHVRVSAGATIVGPTVIGDDTIIHSGSMISRSVVGRSCIVAANSVVHGCVLGNGAVVGPGLDICYALWLRQTRRTWLPAGFGSWLRGDGAQPTPEAAVALPTLGAAVRSIASRRAAS
jgi:mannose-1-phosphate guanylyltransferase